MASKSNRNDETFEQLEAEKHVSNHIFKFITSMSLKSAVELDIPEIVNRHGKPMPLSELINELPINPAKAPYLYRLMRILVHSGFFIQQKIAQNDVEEAFLLTSAGKLLLKDHPSSRSPFLLANLNPIMTSTFHHVSEWFQNDDPDTFSTAHGTIFWEKAGQEPRLSSLFNQGLASDARLVSNVVIENHRDVFAGINSLIDVGGGTGTMAKAIADAFPHMMCSVLDLPHVVDGLCGEQNLVYIGGNMFHKIPTADAILLKNILHDWNDEESVKILKKCKEAISSKESVGKVIIIDMVLDTHQKDEEAIETQLCVDMMMMAMHNGKERTEKDWTKLFTDAGFSNYKINHHVLGVRSLIELYY